MLGMEISLYRLHTLKDRVKVVMEISPPETMGEVYRMVDMFGFY